MQRGMELIRFGVDRPIVVSTILAAATILVFLLAAIPSLMPSSFPFLNPLRVDTDPENMLSSEEPARVFHNEMKRRLGL